MESSGSDSETSYESTDSDYISRVEQGNFDIEVEPDAEEATHFSQAEHENADQDVLNPYDDEPIASQEWLEEYNRELRHEKMVREEMLKRKDKVVPVSDW